MMTALKVTPEKLKAEAAQIETNAQNMKRITAEMQSIIASISGALWSGDAANAYKNKFKQLEDDNERVYQNVKELADDLRAIAVEYTKAEQANMSAAQSLAADIF